MSVFVCPVCAQRLFEEGCPAKGVLRQYKGSKDWKGVKEKY
jgi:hypothetical protein